MCSWLPAVMLTLPLAAADGADALALGPAFLVDFVFTRLLANRKPNATAAQQAALFFSSSR